MKTPGKVFLILFVAMLITGSTFAQEMKSDAAQLYNDGNQKLKSGDYAGAVASFDKALAIEKDYRIYYQKGVAFKKLEKLEDARDAFEECLKAKPDFESGYNALGAVYFAMGNYQEAATNFEKVLSTTQDANVKSALQKNISMAYYKLGVNALKENKPKDAIGYLEKSVADNNYDAAYLSLANAYTQTKEWDKAISAGENAVKYLSIISKGGPYYFMGVAYKGKGDMTKAKEMFEKAKADATYKKNAEYELSSIK
jgi:tetratricopeptide (TPR) repeat protein